MFELFRKEFHCPKCGGTWFGSSGHGTDNLEYFCGKEFHDCRWKGSREEFKAACSYTETEQRILKVLKIIKQEEFDTAGILIEIAKTLINDEDDYKEWLKG